MIIGEMYQTVCDVYVMIHDPRKTFVFSDEENIIYDETEVAIPKDSCWLCLNVFQNYNETTHNEYTFIEITNGNQIVYLEPYMLLNFKRVTYTIGL